MDSDVPSECCVCGVPIGGKGGVGGTLQSTSGLWVCFRRKCWKQHEAVFCPGNERLMAIVNRRRDAESDARMAAHLYADALEHAMKADAERDTATARADAASERLARAEALLREARGVVGPFLRLLNKAHEIVMPSIRGLFALSKRRQRVENALARIDAEAGGGK